MANYAVWRPKGDQITLDTNGDPYAGGLLRYFDATTSDERTVWSDAGSTVWTQPITLDAAGRLTGSVYITTGAFKETFADSADAQVYSEDSIQGALDTSSFTATYALLKATALSKAISYPIVAADMGKIISADATAGDITLTLPSAADATVQTNNAIFIENVGATGIVTVATVSAQTITCGRAAAATTVTLPNQGAFLTLFSNGANWVGSMTEFVMTNPQINDVSSDHQYVFAVSELAADRTVTLPLLAGNDEFTFNAHTQTLTNKTLTTPTVTSPVINTGITGTAVAAASDIRAGTADLVITPAIVESALEYVGMTDAQTLDWAWSAAINFSLTMDNAKTPYTIQLPTFPEPGTWREIRLTQDGTGSVVLAWATAGVNFLFAGGGTPPTLSTAAGAVDTLYIKCINATDFEVHSNLNWVASS